MPQFKIDWRIFDGKTRDKENRKVFQLQISNEWTIMCVYSDVDPGAYSRKIIRSIELHRKDTSKEISVSADLSIFYNEIIEFRKGFSGTIKKGFSYITLCQNTNEGIWNAYILKGFVDVSDKSEEPLTSLDTGESEDLIQIKSYEHLAMDLEKTLDPKSSCFSDVVLKCGSTCIPAHKYILCARSPVFAAMFTHPTRESQKKEVDISDIDASVLKTMLKYMYTGKIAGLTLSLASDMLFAADKYQLLDLKAVCCFYLKALVCPKNVWRILVLGDMHDQNLKSFAVDYIRYKCGQFSVLKEWKDLRKERPDLAMDLMEILVKYRDDKN